MNLYAMLADAIVLLHGLFVLFVVGGQVLILAGWPLRWVWVRNAVFRWSHLAATLFVVTEAWLGMVCPLTSLENALRERAGEQAYEMSFIGYWLNRLLFYQAPEWVFTLIYTVFAITVLAALLGCPPRRGPAGPAAGMRS